MVHFALSLEDRLPATFTAPGLDEAKFLALCEEFPDCTLEYTTDGTVIVMPPTDPDNGRRVLEVGRQLANWAIEHGSGYVVGPDSGFFLPRGSRRSPDAAWFDDRRWKEAKRPDLRYPVFAPEFVIEVRSPHDRPRLLREKMDDYMANGVQLSWLIDPIERTVTIYRPGLEPEIVTNPASITGEGPVTGFVLKLDRVLGP